ncbi:MAG: PQQ-binding-like beta-propeller repeat protein [Bdellovibrionales bacterium]|nr:PQQ-binding-like beta-propeller repeat protein [Bdellovibrionales bacterium]
MLRRTWSYSVAPLSTGNHLGGVEYVSPVIQENTLLFGSSRFGIISFYPEIKRTKWTLPVENGVISQVTTQGGVVYFTGGDGKLYSVSCENGKILWDYDLRNPVTSAPTIKGDDLYLVTSDDSLLSLEQKTGKWQWQYRRRNVSGPVIHGATRPLVLADSIWVGFADGALVSLSRKDGKVLWEKQLNSNKRFSGLNAELAESDGMVFVPAFDQALYALNSKTTNPIWVKEGLGGSKKVTIAGGVVFAPSSQGRVYALEAKSGKEIWNFELDGGVPSEIVVTDRHVIFGSTHEYLYALDRTTGRLVYRQQVGFDSGFSGGLAFDPVRRSLFGLSRGGNLYTFQYLY